MLYTLSGNQQKLFLVANVLEKISKTPPGFSIICLSQNRRLVQEFSLLFAPLGMVKKIKVRAFIKEVLQMFGSPKIMSILNV